jgi:hypothetical protein
VFLGPALDGIIRFGFANSASDSPLGWMFCIAGAVVMAVLTRSAVGATGAPHAGRRALLLIYSALGVIFAFSCWLAFFRN